MDLPPELGEGRVIARALDPDVHLVDSTRLRAIREGAERRAASLADAGVDALNMHHTDWNGGLTTLLHRFDRFAFAWDVQHDYALRTTLRMGIDGVYSDHVDRMMDAFRGRGGWRGRRTASRGRRRGDRENRGG